MILDRIKFLLESCSTSDAIIPPTDLYNEGWMLRLVLDWLHRYRDQFVHAAIPFPPDARWYSEALLPSAFLPRERGDKLAESHTHADGVIGQFTIGGGAKGDLSLESDARCFVVVEAKMFSKLSPGVTNASFYNQAARNVACMAYVLGDAEIRPDSLDTLGFYVVAPEVRIKEPAFSPYMTREHIEKTVKLRVDGLISISMKPVEDEAQHPTFVIEICRWDSGVTGGAGLQQELYSIEDHGGLARRIGVSYSTQIPRFSVAPARKRTRLEALILIASPVAGLLPFRARRLRTSKVPNPANWTFLFFLSDSTTLSKTALSVRLAACPEQPVPAWITLARCRLSDMPAGVARGFGEVVTLPGFLPRVVFRVAAFALVAAVLRFSDFFAIGNHPHLFDTPQP